MLADQKTAPPQHLETLRRIRRPRQKPAEYNVTATVVIILGWTVMVILLAKIESRATAVVRAPPRAVWKRLKNLNAWKQYNDAFAINVSTANGAVNVGAPITISSTWRDGSVDLALERITKVEPETRLCWDFESVPGLPFTVPDVLLGTERCIVLEPAGFGGSRTNVTSYNRFSGPLGVAVGLWMGSTIEEAFERHLDGLKRRCERRWWAPWHK